MHFRLLRVLLLFSAFAWGVSVFGVVLPWSRTVEALGGFGANPIAYDPMLDYWLRMATGVFTLVGVFYFVVALQPVRFANMIPMLGLLMIAEGLILLMHGIRLGLPPYPFYCDTAFCLLVGTGILLLRNSAAGQK